MCIEDLRLGRKRFAQVRGQIIVAAQTIKVPANGRRVLIAFTFSGTSFCQIASELADVTQVVKYLSTEDTFLELRVEDYGNLVERGFAISNASSADQRVSWTEVITDDK